MPEPRYDKEFVDLVVLDVHGQAPPEAALRLRESAHRADWIHALTRLQRHIEEKMQSLQDGMARQRERYETGRSQLSAVLWAKLEADAAQRQQSHRRFLAKTMIRLREARGQSDAVISPSETERVLAQLRTDLNKLTTQVHALTAAVRRLTGSTT